MSPELELQPTPEKHSIPAWRRRMGVALLVILPIVGFVWNLCLSAARNATPVRTSESIAIPERDPDEPKKSGLEVVQQALSNFGARLVNPTEIESLPDAVHGDVVEQNWRLRGNFLMDAGDKPEDGTPDDETEAGTWEAEIYRGWRNEYRLLHVRYSLGGITRHRLHDVYDRTDRLPYRVDLDMSNRVIAEFILAQAASIEILLAGEPKTIDDVKDLPVEPFILRNTTWGNVDEIRAGLGPLNEWIGKWDVVTTARPDKWFNQQRTFENQMAVRQRLGGRFLSVYPFQELGNMWSLSVITFDVQRNQLRRWSCDASGWVDQFSGELDRTSRVVTWTIEGDVPMLMQQSWRIPGPDQIECTSTVPVPIGPDAGRMALDISFSMSREGEPRGE